MAQVVTFDEIKDQVDARGIAPETIQWYYDQGKVTKDEDGNYCCDCMVCRQHHKNADPSVLINIVEGCRTMHVHDKGVTF